MKIRINNPNISQNETTFLTTAAIATGTSHTVKNNQGFAADKYVVVGRPGDEGTETRLIASVSGNNTIVTDALVFPHAINTPITIIDFNQMELQSATSKTGTYTAVGNKANIDIEQEFTEFDDSSGTSTTWYKVRYYNVTTAEYSDYSDAVQGTGYIGRALRKILDKIYIQAHDDKRRTISEDDMIEYLNDAYQKAINKLMKLDHKRFLKKAYVSIKNSYDTGTVAVSDAGTAVVGTSTVWSTGWTSKKIIFGDTGYPYDIASIASETTLTLTQAYDGAGTALTAEGYTIYQDEYDIINSDTLAEVTDFRKMEQVFDEDGSEVFERDIHREESGWYLKKEGENMKFCLNYIPSTSNDEGKWTILYLYQPAKLDSMADEPELPQGFDDLLVDYGIARIKDRLNDLNATTYYDARFEVKLNRMLHSEDKRGSEGKGFRLDRNLQGRNAHDEDWVDDIYSRKTIGT